mmetsp:Transcript_1429/g.2950  ORF Transcript_1429/g.2950 Transcript_1429/m.2950 type:complete len:110 (-) Transcript_1429:126-455(-)
MPSLQACEGFGAIQHPCKEDLKVFLPTFFFTYHSIPSLRSYMKRKESEEHMQRECIVREGGQERTEMRRKEDGPHKQKTKGGRSSLQTPHCMAKPQLCVCKERKQKSVE